MPSRTRDMSRTKPVVGNAPDALEHAAPRNDAHAAETPSASAQTDRWGRLKDPALERAFLDEQFSNNTKMSGAVLALLCVAWAVFYGGGVAWRGGDGLPTEWNPYWYWSFKFAFPILGLTTAAAMVKGKWLSLRTLRSASVFFHILALVSVSTQYSYSINVQLKRRDFLQAPCNSDAARWLVGDFVKNSALMALTAFAVLTVVFADFVDMRHVLTQAAMSLAYPPAVHAMITRWLSAAGCTPRPHDKALVIAVTVAVLACLAPEQVRAMQRRRNVFAQLKEASSSVKRLSRRLDETSGRLTGMITASKARSTWQQAAQLASEQQAVRHVDLMSTYVPPKELRPGTSGEQLKLMELESEITGGFQATDTRTKMSMCFDKVRKVLDEVVADADLEQLSAVQRVAGEDHRKAYGACHAIVKNDDGHGDFCASVRRAAMMHSGVSVDGVRTCRQRQGDLYDLYAEAYTVKQRFSEHMSTLVSTFRDCRSAKDEAAVKLHLAPLKHLYRCMEKMCLKGGSDRYTSHHICDIVRCIVECENSRLMAGVLDALLASDSLRVVRVKDRANNTTSMNWMDVMVNVTLVCAAAEQPAHICEVQIVHTKMLLARSGLGGHGPYNKMRAASEILQLHTCMRAENDVGNESQRGPVTV